MGVLDLLFDRRCAICQKHIETDAVCSDCDEKIKSLINVRKRLLDVEGKSFAVYYLFDYDSDIVKRLLFQLKRASGKDLFRYAKKLYLSAVPENFHGVATHCPRTGKNVRNFGYDQVASPCRILCNESDGRLEYQRLVKRIGRSKEQKKLTLEQRRENTKNKFKVIKKDIPENILILDDVVTTGSSVGACIREILKHREDANISVVCLASRGSFPGKG